MITAENLLGTLDDFSRTPVLDLQADEDFDDTVPREYLKIKTQGFQVERDGVGISRIHLVRSNAAVQPRNGADQSLANITRQQAQTFLDFVENGYFDDYRLVKQRQDWQNLYHIELRNLLKMRNGWGGTKLKAILSGPCVKCRVIFPLANLTVDHQKPKTNSGYLPLLRIFRGLGLTMGAPQAGGKNRIAYRANRANVSSTPAQDPAPSGHASKITLNSAGRIYFSLLAGRNIAEDFNDICLNHYLNLRPACNICNSSMRNRNV